jgi:hypothetical protein
MIHDGLEPQPARTPRDDAERVHGEATAKIGARRSTPLDLEQRADQILRSACDDRRTTIGGVLPVAGDRPHEQQAEHVQWHRDPEEHDVRDLASPVLGPQHAGHHHGRAAHERHHRTIAVRDMSKLMGDDCF